MSNEKLFSKLDDELYSADCGKLGVPCAVPSHMSGIPYQSTESICNGLNPAWCSKKMNSEYASVDACRADLEKKRKDHKCSDYSVPTDNGALKIPGFAMVSDDTYASDIGGPKVVSSTAEYLIPENPTSVCQNINSKLCGKGPSKFKNADECKSTLEALEKLHDCNKDSEEDEDVSKGVFESDPSDVRGRTYLQPLISPQTKNSMEV